MVNAYESLFFRRQFMLVNGLVPELQSWQRQKIGDAYILAHPDLDVTVREGSSSIIVLLGYIFDPFHPEKNNSDIISDVYSRIGCFEDLISVLKPYTGRYALIYRDSSDFVILHDPYGVREIYYCTQPNRIVCGSQPNLLEHFSDPKIEVAVSEDLQNFYNYDMKPIRFGRLWVGEETIYQNVKHLRPNHYLNISSLSAKRYWPNKRLESIDLSMAVKLSCCYLKGAIKAATSRFRTMMAVTSGYDSRSLLAASREVQGEIYYFINKHPPLNDKSPDIRIPKQMCHQLNIPFHIHEVDGPVDEGFKAVFLNNTFWALERQLPAIYNIYYKKHQDKLNLLGLGEIGRVYYGEAPHDIDGYYLARRLKYRSSRYATKQCEKWLLDAKRIAEIYNIDIMKLFLWEELIGNWGVVGNSESDIAIEEFDPYSSHYLGEIMLAFDRTQGDLFNGMFKEMWPELLDFPFNPPEKLQDWIKYLLEQMGLLLPLQRQLSRFDKWRYRKYWRTALR